MQKIDFSSAEEDFYRKLQLKGAVVTITSDKTAVTIDGVAKGSFEDTKVLYAADWAASQTKVTETTAKNVGTTILGVVCSATDTDLDSVMATAFFMDRAPGQTNVDIAMSNGNVVTIADDTELDTFVSAFLALRLANSTFYSFGEGEI